MTSFSSLPLSLIIWQSLPFITTPKPSTWHENLHHMRLPQHRTQELNSSCYTNSLILPSAQLPCSHWALSLNWKVKSSLHDWSNTVLANETIALLLDSGLVSDCTAFSVLYTSLCYLNWVGRAIAEAVSRWLPTAAAQVWQVKFVVDKVASGQVFSEYFGFPCQYRSFHQLLHHHRNHPGQLAEGADHPSKESCWLS
jgi:hypothetical protein